MNLITCIHTQSDCYGKYRESANQVGIVVHSTGVNNTSIARYSQPSNDDPNRTKLLNTLGTNKYGNHWNRPNVKKAVHYIIGKIKDGSVATVQNLPEDIAAWGVGRGSKGSYNYNPTAHIQFEVCEDGLTNGTYFNVIYKEATELCADICYRHNWNSNVICSHKEAAQKGYASSHADIDHWLGKFGKTMNDFRAEVQRLLDIKRKPEEVTYVPKVGDTVNFVGTTHYRNANAVSGYTCVPGLAYVSRIYPGKHPYLLKPTKGSKSTVNGWVDTQDVQKYTSNPNPVPTPTPIKQIKIGDQVKLVQGSTWINGKTISSWVFKVTLYVREIQEKDGKTIYLLSRYEKAKIYTGKVYREAIVKV